MSRTSIGTLGYPSPSRTQPNHALTHRTSTSTLSLKLKQEPSTYTENALSRCKPLQTSHRNYMDQADRAPDNGTFQRVAERTGNLRREPRDISGREGLGIRETGATGDMRVRTRPWCVSLAHSLSSFTFIILPTSASQCILETD
nr:hypothetical protein B23L21.20 [imported] - Neurospora crassa [Neurospora crassa]